jgi:pantoate--beta-alanine ligase
MSKQNLNLIESVSEMKEARDLFRSNHQRIGFVPTMGALHDGHMALLKKSVSENDITVCSIYVNPTQFNDKKDFENYPLTRSEDLAMLEAAGVQVAFCPSYTEMYADDYRFKISESQFSQLLCGAHRPGHFDGVLTVVMKLFQIVKPHNAYFGEKDLQQLTLIQDMAKAFFLDVNVVPCPTIREHDGLAMSSRNRLLTPDHRRLAPLFSKSLKSEKSPSEVRTELEEIGFEVDYIEDTRGHRFGAAKLGSVRLIDNVSK